MQEAIAGHKESFGQIFRLYRDRAYGLAFQYTRNKEDALDVVQDAFVRAYLNLGKFDLSRGFAPWLLRIVRNLSIDHLRRRRNQPSEDLPEIMPDLKMNKATHPERSVLRHEVVRAMERLAPEQREIIYLKDYEGHSYAEIAEIMSIPLGTVMSRLHHARKKLAEIVLG